MADLLRVLYVDDEPDLLEISRLFLEHSGGFSVATIGSASAALELLKIEQFDAIISDYQMPGMDGIRFLTEVRAKFGQVPFVLFTGKGREAVVIQAINSGVDFYVQKGGDPESQYTELAYKVRTAVERRASEKAFKESENRYRSLVENLHDCVVVYRAVSDGEDFEILEFNHAAEKIENISREQVIGHRVTGVFPGVRKFGILDVFRRVWRTGIPESLPVSLYRDERICGWRDNFVYKLPSGEIIASYSDETIRKQAEVSLRKSEEKYRLTLDATNDGIWDWNIPTGNAFFSPRWYSMLGYGPGDLPGTYDTWRSLLHPDDVVAAEQMIRGHIGRKYDSYSVEFRMRTKDGEWKWVLSRGKVVERDSDGNPARMVGTHTDITGRKQAEEALRASGEQLACAIEGSGVGLWDWYVQTGIVVFNERWAEIAGYTLSELSPVSIDTWTRLCHPKDLVKSDDLLKKHFSGQSQMYECEVRVRHREGHWIWVLDRGKVVEWDDNGLPVRMTGTHLDITDRKKAEDGLRRLTEFQESVITNARVWLSVLDPKGTILLWNTAAEEISGYSRDEVIGRNDIWKKIYPDKGYRKKITDTITRIIRDRNYLENFETTILSRHGAKKVISWNTRSITDAGGKVSESIAIGVDVTDRAHAEGVLHETERRLGDIINFLPDPTFAIDHEGKVIAWNRAIEDLSGVRADDMLGMGDYEYALPFYGVRRPILIDLVMEQDPEILKQYTSVRMDGGALTAETTKANRGNGGVHLWGKSVLFKDDLGNVLGAIESIRDITSRKNAELALTQANRKLTLLSGITRHDINNLLTLLLGNLKLLQKDEPGVAANTHLQKALTAARRISATIRFTREYEQIGVTAPSWQDCRTLVETAVQQAHPGEVGIQNDIPPGREVYADPLIVKVFYNLIDNAVHHGGKTTTIRFSCEESGGDHLIRCEDDGNGVPEGEKERIFDCGYGTKPDMGLFLSREILGISGITITENGEPGTGAQFVMTVPGGMYR